MTSFDIVDREMGHSTVSGCRALLPVLSAYGCRVSDGCVERRPPNGGSIGRSQDHDERADQLFFLLPAVCMVASQWDPSLPCITMMGGPLGLTQGPRLLRSNGETMPAFICSTCGTQYPPSEIPPAGCPICIDERQYVPASGQSWTTLERLRNTHSNMFRRLAAGLTTIETTPPFGIRQRAILAQTPAGNVLWDCLALIDDATIDVLKGFGGVAAIAISHPHYYTTMVEWSRALGGVPIHLHAADRQWVMRPDAAVQFWEGDTKSLGPGVTLVRLGGHFDGGTVLHWADWGEGRGVVLSGDVLQVVPSGHVSFMWSYPNLIPLSAASVRRIAEILQPFAYDAVYGAFSGRGQIDSNGKQVVAASVARYIARISEA
jgi:hypothetical protein